MLPVALFWALSFALTAGAPAHAQTPCTPGVVGQCDDLNDCTQDDCDPLAAVCTHVPFPDGDGCDDASGCTAFDTCQAGACVGLPVARCQPCQGNDDCEDGDDCTIDTCEDGACQRAGGAGCDDDDPCTANDRCVDGTCAGDLVVCDDGVACTADFCSDGACVSQAESSGCPTPGECAAIECQPGAPGADVRGCVVLAESEGGECSEDENPCTIDRCRAGGCAHDAVDDLEGCRPLLPSYGRAMELRRGVERVLNFVQDEADAGGDTADLLVEHLEGLRGDLEAATLVLAGREAGSEPPAGALRGPRLAATATTAQLRGRLALAWVRGAPRRVQRFLGAVSRGRRTGDLEPDPARELRRNGRILLAGTKDLKRDVKNLQRTFSVFQR